ncbi:unnamed protein product, partial [Vitis vinifera]
MMSSETMLVSPFPSFEGGFTPWDSQELFSIFQSQEPVLSRKKKFAVRSKETSGIFGKWRFW